MKSQGCFDHRVYGTKFLRTGDFFCVCYAGTNFCDEDILVFLLGINFCDFPKVHSTQHWFFQCLRKKYIFSNNHIFKSLLVSRGRITDLSRYLLERLYTELEVAGSISIPRILKNKRENKGTSFALQTATPSSGSDDQSLNGGFVAFRNVTCPQLVLSF